MLWGLSGHVLVGLKAPRVARRRGAFNPDPVGRTRGWIGYVEWERTLWSGPGPGPGRGPGRGRGRDAVML